MASLRALLLAGIASLTVTGVQATCGTDNCLQIAKKFPEIKCEFSSFCESLLHSTPGTKTSTRTSTSYKTVTRPGTTTTIRSGTTTVTSMRPIFTVSATSTETTTVTITPATQVIPVTIPVTVPSVVNVQCTETTTVSSLTTSIVSYVTRSPDPPARRRDADSNQLDDRNDGDLAPRHFSSISSLCNKGCEGKAQPLNSRLSSACSCFLTSSTKYRTTTTTKTATVTGKPCTTTIRSTAYVTVPGRTVTVGAAVTKTNTITITLPQGDPIPTTVFATVSAPSSVCTGTTTETSFNFPGGQVTCGAQTFAAVPTASTTGSVSCTSSVPLPSQNALFRIEGEQSGEGTIYENCIVSGPRVVTTPSGGSHQCDGTNNGANPFPGTTPTDMIDAAGRADGFGYDGSFSAQYQDYFITTISSTSQGGSKYWGVLNNQVFTPTGGCQYISDPGTETEWVFNAFNYNSFLQVQPGYAAAEANSGSVIVTVSAANGNGGNVSPRAGASLGGQISAADGTVALSVPSGPGCYQYKALQNGAAPSNGFFLVVLPDGSFA